jgi:hypothetical protein
MLATRLCKKYSNSSRETCPERRIEDLRNEVIGLLEERT